MSQLNVTVVSSNCNEVILHCGLKPATATFPADEDIAWSYLEPLLATVDGRTPSKDDVYIKDIQGYANQGTWPSGKGSNTDFNSYSINILTGGSSNTVTPIAVMGRHFGAGLTSRKKERRQAKSKKHDGRKPLTTKKYPLARNKYGITSNWWLTTNFLRITSANGALTAHKGAAWLITFGVDR